MAELKTKATKVSVKDFIARVPSETRRRDALALLKLFEKATGWKPQMWGPTIVGYGRYKYTYDSGHSGESLVVGFSPRTSNLAIYAGIYPKEVPELMKAFGKHKTGAACIYVNKLEDVDLAVFEKLIKAGVANIKKKWGAVSAS